MPSRTLPRALAPLVLSVALVSPLVPASALVPTPGSPGSGDSILPRKGNGGYDVRHYALDVSWKPQRSAITGTARINAVATQDLSSYNLDLAGLTVREVRVAGRPATFSRSGSELTVTPAVPLDRGQRFKMTLEYDGQPAPLRSRALGRTGWIPTKDGATTLSEPVGSETWFPVNNTIRDKATYSFAVDVPNHLKVASNGRLVGRDTGPERTTWRWRESSPMAPYLPMISIGRYKVFRSNHDGLPLVTFVDAKLGRQVQARRALPKVIDFFESKFGRYPFGSSGMVIDKVSVGYALETQSRPVFAGDAPSYLIAHEIAHQWFGNSVTPDDWRHIWLNEGFATYTEWLWDAERYDAPRSAHRQFNFLYDIYGRQAKFWDRPPGDPGTAAHLFDLPVYDRGAMTLHALRLKVGDKAFFATLRAWATRNAGENVSTRDFKLLAERVSGNQLDRLFRAWVYAPSKPKGY